MTYALTLAAVRKLNPCSESYARVSAILPKRGKVTAAQARDAGCTFDDLLWIASKLALKNKAIERRLRHWAADCAAHVLHFYERDHPNDMRPRNAIKAARDLADGLIDGAARSDAAGAAWAAARDAAAAAWAAAAARAAARAAAWDAARAAWAAARDAAAAAAAWDAAFARAAAWDAEQQWQFDRLVLWLSEDEPEPFEFRQERGETT